MSLPDGFRTLTMGSALYVAQRMRDLDLACVRATFGGLDAERYAINRFQTHGAAWFMEEDGEPVAMFGLEMQHDKACIAWLCCTNSMRSFKKLMRFSRTVADNAANAGVRRIEVQVLDGWGAAERFAQRLGCEFEGTRRLTGINGESFHVFSRISS